MNKLDGKTLDLVEQNIDELKKLFPEVITEGKIDFDRLRLLLGDEVDTGKEKYEFTWPGKSECIRLSQQQSTGTLRPDKESSKDWDTTQNLYIEGDNLEVLRLLQKAYHRKVKMIYIDPPYNTGNDFIYKDDFIDNVKNYKDKTEQSMKANPATGGRYHTDWLNMIYPRLRLARNLLMDEGVIFISIDDNEVDNLKKICNEVFGESNYICDFIRKGSGGRQDSKHYAIIHEYVLCYSKDINYFISGKEIKNDDVYPFYDMDKKLHYKTQLLRKWGENSRREDRPNLYYPIPDPEGNDLYPMLSETEEGCWRWGKKKMIEEINHGNVEFKKKNGKWIAYEKIYEPAEGNSKTKLYTTIVDNISNSSGAPLLKELFNGKVFNYPKPLELIKRIIQVGNIDKGSIILDFFSGSATTAHAVMHLNAEDEGSRKFILVQLPEVIDNNSEAYKAGFYNICEIGKERIRRAGEKIKEEYKDKEGIENLDTGFKVFKLDTSNLKAWDPDVEELEETLKGMVDPIKEDRTQEDMLYEIMLKYGIDLTMPLEEIQIKGKNAYSIGLGYMIVCLEDGLTLDVIEAIGAMKQSGREIARVVFRDSGFADDNVKTNAVQLLKKFGIEDFRTI